jgi:hypothetical protein
VSVESDQEFQNFMRGRWPVMVRLAYTLAPGAQASQFARWLGGR